MVDLVLEKVRKILELAETAGPVPEVRVKEAETALSVHFPQAYREFVLSFGAAMGTGWEAFGIDSARTSNEAPPLFADVVETTLLDRRAARGEQPDHCIPIAHDGMELGFYLDLSSVQSGDCPVVGLGPGVDYVQAAPSFVDFLIGWSANQLEGFP